MASLIVWAPEPLSWLHIESALVSYFGFLAFWLGFQVVEFRIFVQSSPFFGPKNEKESVVSVYLIILVLSVLSHVISFAFLKKIVRFLIWTCLACFTNAVLVILIFLFLFLVCHFQFSESVDCNLAAYMYLCLYPILGTQHPGQK